MGGHLPLTLSSPPTPPPPAVAALAGGGFVVVWVSEQQRVIAYPTTNQFYAPSQLPYPSVDIYARLYDANGLPVVNEFMGNTGSNVCANPCVPAASDGGVMFGSGDKDRPVHDKDSFNF